jgi:5'-deoxynucleotidase
VGHFFAYVFRMRHIRRWSLMKNVDSENLMEHTAEVAMLAHALALIRRDVLGLPCDPGRAAALALYHDAGETMTGDLPTPVKYATPRLRQAFGEIEAAARERLLSMLPAALSPAYAELLTPDAGDAENLHALVKAADRLSAYLKCMAETKAGNPEFRKAGAQIRAALEGMKLPEIRYFMEHFLPSFALTLDEINGNPAGPKG